jgi:hypothetical protein
MKMTGKKSLASVLWFLLHFLFFGFIIGIAAALALIVMIAVHSDLVPLHKLANPVWKSPGLDIVFTGPSEPPGASFVVILASAAALHLSIGLYVLYQTRKIFSALRTTFPFRNSISGSASIWTGRPCSLDL